MLDKKKKALDKNEKVLNIDNVQNSKPGKDKDLRTSKLHELRFAVEPDVILTKETPHRHSKENEIRFAIEPGVGSISNISKEQELRFGNPDGRYGSDQHRVGSITSISKEHELRFGHPDGRYNSDQPRIGSITSISKEQELRFGHPDGRYSSEHRLSSGGQHRLSDQQLREHQWREHQLREYQLKGHQLRQQNHQSREPSVRLSKLDTRAAPWASSTTHQQKKYPPSGLYNNQTYEMAAFDTCCCCSLRAGSTIIGLFSLVLSLGVGAALCLVMVAAELQEVLKSAYYTYHDLENPTKTYAPNGTIIGAPEWRNLEDPELMYVELVIIAILIYMFCCSVVDSLLVIGAIWEKTYLLVPWMVVQWITIFCTIGIFGIILWHELVTMPRYWWAVMFVVGCVILMVLAFVVVLSLYQMLRDREYPEYYQGAELVHRHMWLSHNNKGKYYE